MRILVDHERDGVRVTVVGGRPETTKFTGDTAEQRAAEYVRRRLLEFAHSM